MAKGFFIDMTGNTYNYLTVINLNKEKSDEMGCLYWDCICKCGNKVTVAGSNLRRGDIKSCGCLRRERMSKSNRIEFDENLGCLRVYFNNCDDYFLCDVEDRDIAEQYCWYKNSYGYAVHKDKHIIHFHRLVMEKYEDIEDSQVDHINNDRLDNRRFNLRKSDNGNNSRNTIGYSNTGERNICYDKSRDKYVFSIMINGKKYMKRFNTKDEAIEYREQFKQDHPNDFYYNPLMDARLRDPSTIIHPFKFIDQSKIIKPFYYINNEE